MSDTDWLDRVHQIGGLLGAEETKPDEYCGIVIGATLEMPQRRAVYVLHEPKEGRLRWMGAWPTTKRGHRVTVAGDNPSATSLLSRRPSDVARDLRRHFLPRWQRRWDEYAAAVRVAEQKEAETLQTLQRYGALIQGSRVDDRNGSMSLWCPSPYGRIKADAGEVQIQFWGLPQQVAERIIKIVENHRRSQR